MRVCSPFLPDDLEALEALYERADAVIPMERVAHRGGHNPRWLALRHDIDNEIYSSVQMAMWEAARGYYSTYYVLHTAPYYADKPLLRRSLEAIVNLGHTLGLHNDAITVALETGRGPADVLHEALDELRGYGHTIQSTVAHGNQLCHIANYVNDEMFVGCARPGYGAADRTLEHGGRKVTLTPRPLAEFGLDFDANWLPRGDYLSDSGGRWSQPFDEVADAFPSKGQLHVLVHACWWTEAFERTKAAA